MAQPHFPLRITWSEHANQSRRRRRQINPSAVNDKLRLPAPPPSPRAQFHGFGTWPLAGRRGKNERRKNTMMFQTTPCLQS